MWKKLNLDKVWVVDIEATCWDEKDFNNSKEHRSFQVKNRELIEFGVTEINLKDQISLNKFTYIVKPKNSTISEYCTNLTGIDDSLINNQGIDLHKMSKELRKKGSLNTYIVAWGAFDFNFLKEECKKKKVIFPFSDNYLNLSDIYAWKNRLSRGIGLKKALKQYNIEFEGDHHRAIWDSYNTAKLFLKLFDIS